ncbi:MAG: hypothetical protein MJZ76_03825 [Bacteroidales bacterium]|nr:hypothetical protein [Bacteroidales bacterium]
MTTEQQIEILKHLVAEHANHKIETSTDFIFLSGMIQERVKATLGATTLKRIWGYIDGYANTRTTSLDILAKFVGFTDWDTFVSDFCMTEDAQSSHSVSAESIATVDLPVHAKIELGWNPNRQCIIEHLGDGNFIVLESENAKLKVGDTFHCERFTMNMICLLDNAVLNGEEPGLFKIAGKGGLTRLRIVQ